MLRTVNRSHKPTRKRYAAPTQCRTDIHSSQCQSCLMPDEPEAGPWFSHKMSLKRRFRMLGIDHQHGRRRTTEPGADPGLGGSQRGSPIPLPGPRGVVRVGEPDIAAAGLAQTRRQRIGAYIAKMTGLSRGQTARLRLSECSITSIHTFLCSLGCTKSGSKVTAPSDIR